MKDLKQGVKYRPYSVGIGRLQDASVALHIDTHRNLNQNWEVNRTIHLEWRSKCNVT